MLRSFYKLYLLMSISVIVSALGLVPILRHMFVTNLGTGDAVRYTAYQVRDLLTTQPESQWQTTLHQMRAPFSLMGIDLIPRAQEPLALARQNELDHGLAIYERDNSLLLALPSSNMLLRVTQSPVLVAEPTFNILVWSLITLLQFGTLLLWLRMHWRDLERLSIAADRFGEGNLTARAALPDRSSVAPLARRFDGMATRIETLVTTQNEMVNAISHELRTPITRFGFGLALLQAARDDDERQRHAKALGHDVAELDELVSELLSYGALNRAGRTPERHLTRMGELIDSVLGGLTLEMELLGVTCAVEIQASAERAVLDPRLTARALINLVKNATRYCHGRITIRALALLDRLVIHVDDDGIGIPAAERDTIFEPFHRLDRSRDRSTGGFGLGLAIAKRASEAQGGRLRALVSPLGGARFELTLPLDVEPSTAAAP